MDQMVTLMLDSIDDVVCVLFFCKMHAFILDVVNLKDHKNSNDLTQRCNEVWENKAETSAMSSAAINAPAHLSLAAVCGSCRSSSPFQEKRPAQARSSHCLLPTSAWARGSRDGKGLCLLPLPVQSPEV